MGIHVRALAVGLIVAVFGLSWVVAQQPQSPGASPLPAHFKWEVDRGSPDGSGYSALTQINKTNVTRLQKVWEYKTGNNELVPFNPIIVGRVAYVQSRGNITALDAATGKELWRVTDPSGNRRGINYWSNPTGTDRRLLAAYGNFLYAINAEDGKLIPTFGNEGRVDLKSGLDRDPGNIVGVNPSGSGRVFENLIIIGSNTGEGYITSSPGHIRAYDVRTGNIAWTFRTIPHPGEFGYETWPKEAWQYTGGANNWGEMALDVNRGIVYANTGSPTYDWYGAARCGNNLFGNSLIALDARTGKRLWHFQLIHHDLWDMDVVSSPQLVTIRSEGRTIDAVASGGKSGMLFVFDRVTGQPIWPIEERPVPASDVPGECASPTQPFPTKPPPYRSVDPIDLTKRPLNPYILTDEEREFYTDLIKNARNGGVYTPLSLDKWTIYSPGHSGGSNVFSTSADPTRGLVFVLSYPGPAIQKMAVPGQNDPNARDRRIVAGTPTDPIQACQDPRRNGGRGTAAAAGAGRAGGGPAGGGEEGEGGGGGRGRGAGAAGAGAAAGAAPAAGAGRGVVARGGGPAPTPPSYPVGSGVEGQAAMRYTQGAYNYSGLVFAPPWATYTAYDLNTGTIKWQIPVGDAPGDCLPPNNNFGDTGIHIPKSTLTITASGLAFGETRDKKLRAYDVDTGKVLWVTDLPGMSQGATSTYELDGRQYVIAHAEGTWLAYALPPAP